MRDQCLDRVAQGRRHVGRRGSEADLDVDLHAAATGKPGNLQIRLMDPATQNKRAGLGACTGDSGAPVFDTSREVVGVVSWSTGPNNSDGCGGLTGVTPLSLYRGWIVETAKKLGSSLD